MYTQDSELQAITTPQLKSKIHKSPQHPLSFFQPAVSSPAVPWQRLLTVEILQIHALKSSLHRLQYRTDLVAPIFSKKTPLHGPRRNTPFPTVPLLLLVDSLLRERVYRAVVWKRFWCIRLSRGRRTVTALHATIFFPMPLLYIAIGTITMLRGRKLLTSSGKI
jgi:hypothetical protein